MSLGKFALNCLLITLVTVGLYQVIVYTNPDYTATYDNVIFIAVLVISFLSYFSVFKIKKFDNSYFFMAVLVTIILRLILFAGINFLIIYFDKVNAANNVILFFTFYLLLTVPEVMGLFKLTQMETPTKDS